MVDLLIAWLGNVPEAIWGALATAALGGVGYVVKRHIDQRPQLTTIEKAKHLLDLSDGLKKSGTSFDELQRLEQRIMTKTTRRKDNKKGLEEEVKAATKEDTKELLTQYEMNKHSYDAFKVADAKLRYIITSLEILLGDKELGRFRLAQDAWEKFRELQADFAGSQFEGGTIAPLMINSELLDSTLERAAWLQSHVDFLKEI